MRRALELARRVRLPSQTLARHLLLAVLAGLFVYWLSGVLGPFDDFQLANVGLYFAAIGGLTILIGLNGQISLGHGALMAVGAYATALLISRAGWALVPALAASAAITAAVGVLVGAAAARLRGPYLAGATLAFAIGLPALANRYPSTFGGDNGVGVPPPTPPASLGIELERWQAWIAWLAALAVFVVLMNLARSGTGRALRAVRDDEVAAALSGFHVARMQIVAFVVSAACAGLAGGVFAVINSLAAPGAFTLGLSLTLLTGAVVGGLGSLMGAVWGSILIVLLPSWSSDLSKSLSLSTDVQNNLPNAIYGVVLILVMFVAPDGIQGLLVRLGRLVERRVAAPAREPAPRR